MIKQNFLYWCPFAAVTLATSACNTTPAAKPKPPQEVFTIEHREAFADIRQHISLSALAAGYYCTHGRKWPTSPASLKIYQEQYKIPVQQPIHWEWFASPAVDYAATKNLTIKTPKSARNPYPVTCIHMPPDCNQNPIKANLAFKVGDSPAE